ncbi:uncharacterized protein JCM10292_006172 [Rhodotorula paludigena]|uniref:uncharacterized protein n=1 Tax=Rhodotorula paludigena TaxID=86838 RepID=UPI00316EC7EB
MGIATHEFVDKTLPAFLLRPVCKDCLCEPLEVCDKAHVMCRGCRFPPPTASASGTVADGTNGDEGAGAGGGAVESSSRSNARPTSQQAEVMPRQAPTACSLCSQDLVADPAAAESLATIIGSLVVYCHNISRGCSWTGPLVAQKAHLDDCQFFPRPCPAAEQGCEFEGVSSKLAKHRETDCPFTLVPCPRECDQQVRERRELQIHERVCDAWPCTATPGCPTVTTRKRLPVHEFWCRDQAKELKMLKRVRKSLRDQLEKAKEELPKNLTASQVEAQPGLFRADTVDGSDASNASDDENENAPALPPATAPPSVTRVKHGSLPTRKRARLSASQLSTPSTPSKRAKSVLALDFEERAESEDRAASQAPPSTAPAGIAP